MTAGSSMPLIWRSDAKVDEALLMFTKDAGEEIAPYHHLQIMPLPRDRWVDWLDPNLPAQGGLTYLPAGMVPPRAAGNTIPCGGNSVGRCACRMAIAASLSGTSCVAPAFIR